MRRQFRVGTQGFRRVGRVYSHHRGRELYEYPCTLGGGNCVHLCCRVAALREAGHALMADRLKANSRARDWLSNWGRMVYDPKEHARDPARRALAARIVRGMRAGAFDYADAVVGGAWAGALMPG